ncbi:MAG: 2OG-Fe(II) oxygenase, partial [Bacteroidetes bacterium]|nr:2OG-Fe(II) oxygenase [Bacteroidota bacterium]
MEGIINPAYYAPERVKQLHQDFETAFPCKYIVMDNFLTDDIANALYENFPKMEDLNVRRKSLNEDKAEDYHFERFHPAFSQVRDTLQSEDFYKLMSEISGVEGLFSVQGDSLGAGVHQGGPGSYVDVHIDVNMNPKYNIWRRLNLLIYLNKHWQAEYGGDLELWNTEMTVCEKKIPPLFNKAVLFYTDDTSPHGYARINIPPHESRKSFYAYYYTPVEAGVEFRDSKFLNRPDDTISKKVMTKTKENLKITVKSFLHK